jgi:hypothetical protein
MKPTDLIRISSNLENGIRQNVVPALRGYAKKHGLNLGAYTIVPEGSGAVVLAHLGLNGVYNESLDAEGDFIVADYPRVVVDASGVFITEDLLFNPHAR